MPYQILKILMLHGHQQSAPIFEPKTYWIQRAFHQFASDRDVSFEFQFLSGKLPAYPDREEECDQWVWGYGDPRHGEIKKIEQSIQHILDTLDRDGPFAGIVGFSSGAAMAAIIASLLEKQGTIPNYPWKIQSAKLKFVICLSGFRLGSAYDAIYQPAISTPTLAAIGSRDPVISPVQTRLLADQCQNAKLFEFSGTHYVPQREEFPAFCRVLGDFLEDVLYPSQIEQAKGSGAIDHLCSSEGVTLGDFVQLYQNPTCRDWQRHTIVRPARLSRLRRRGYSARLKSTTGN